MNLERMTAMARPLSTATLAAHAARVAVPRYDRAALAPAIVHLGVGGFHRAHQAVYLDELASRGVTAWGEVGVGLHRRKMKEALDPQDCLYTVVERGAEGDAARVVGVTGRYLFAPEKPGAVLDVLADSRTRLVTLTVTMAGYHIDPVSGDLKAEDPAVRADLGRPAVPTTIFGYLCEALERRRVAGHSPFTILSCDNMQDNGGAARTVLLSFARLRDRALGDWIEDTVAFPSSMVDRITPETTLEGQAWVARRFGVADRWPVVTEPFTQWIVEDTFGNGRPPLDEVGVQFVPDVAPYLRMKTRLLNASHSAMGYVGSLLGYRSTDQAMGDPLIRAYITGLMDDEVTPLLPNVPGIDLPAYKRTLLRRFANPEIRDELARLCARGSTKMPTFLLPSVAEALQRGAPHDLLTLAVAAWFRYLRGVDCEGRPIDIQDARKERLRELALRGGHDPRPLLGERDIFGDLGRNAAFVASLERAARAFEGDGLRATIAAATRRASHGRAA